ncbi:MAG: hypothetical protein LUD01_00190 [Clostridiales bacterium]|nr:hypothetical protein [Clostridiales bacterium]
MYTISRHITRKPKKFSKPLQRAMIVFTVIFVLCGIIFENGYFMPALLMAGLYFLYTGFTCSGFEYTFEEENFTVETIYGKSRSRESQVLYYKNLEVIAPPDHETVLKYKKKGGTEKIKKYDYTSYQDNVPYYTVIIKTGEKEGSKIKLLMDLDEEILRMLKLRYPQKVFLQ